MTGKERAALRSRANSLDALFQIGKGGVSDAFIEQVDGALNKRELIKFKVLLDSSPIKPKEAAEITSLKTHADVIQVIGGVVVLYRYNPELHEEKSEAVKTRAKVKKVYRPVSNKQLNNKNNRKIAALKRKK